MSIPLVDALRMADPEPGVYRLRVNGLDVKVTVTIDDEAADTPIVTYGSRSAADTDPTAAPSSTSGT